MHYVFIIGTLLFVITTFAMEISHTSLSPLTIRLTLCARTNSDFLRDQMDRIPPSPRSPRRYRYMKNISNRKSRPQQPFLELSRQKQKKLLAEYQKSFIVEQTNASNELSDNR